MNMSILRRVAALIAVLALTLTLSACFSTPDVVIEQGDSTETEETSAPTFPAKEGQMTLSILMSVMGETMKWSKISTYTHDVADDGKAVFAVADNYGKECTLTVAYDESADNVTEAVLSYGDQSVSVLSDNTLVIRTIMIAMNEG